MCIRDRPSPNEAPHVRSPGPFAARLPPQPRRVSAMDLLDFDMAFSDTEARPKPTKRPRGPPRLRDKPAAPARQVPKPKATGNGGAKGRAESNVKLSANADAGHRADGLRPPTLAELRCPPSANLAPLTDVRAGGVITVGADRAGLSS